MSKENRYSEEGAVVVPVDLEAKEGSDKVQQLSLQVM